MGLSDDARMDEAETAVEDIVDEDGDDVDVVAGDVVERPSSVAVADRSVESGNGASASAVTLDQAVTEYFMWEEAREAKRKNRKTSSRAVPAKRTVFELDEGARQAINRFLSHVGPATPIVELNPNGIERFQQIMGDNTTDLESKLRPVKEFLRYCWKEREWCEQNLGNHLKIKRSAGGVRTTGNFTHEEAETFEMTAEGLEHLKRELSEAEARMPDLIQAVAAAREDKDIRENAPLEAAREQQERLSSRIDELRYQIDRAVVREAADTGRAQIGSLVTVVVVDSEGAEQGQSKEYTLVGTTQANAAERRISVDSPLGRGLLDQQANRVIEIDAPSGRKRFKLVSVAAAPPTEARQNA